MFYSLLARLQPSASADGEPMIGNGPLLEADPYVSGFNILDCADLDEAVEVASKHPVATFGVLELRAFADN